MILTIDIGNSNTVFVGYNRQKEVVYEHRVLTFKKNTEALLTPLLQEMKIDVEDVIISCVVPSIQEIVVETIVKVFKIQPKLVNGKTIEKYTINIDQPQTLGADLICTSVGAYAKYDAPVIVADIGTASKVTLTHKGGVYQGGVIWPGIGSSLKSMVDMIPHLPTVDLKKPDSVLGTNTISAIQSGMIYGVVAQIEGIANRIEQEIGEKCERVLTGGYSVLFKDLLPEFNYEEHLVSEGLIEIYLNDMVKTQ